MISLYFTSCVFSFFRNYVIVVAWFTLKSQIYLCYVIADGSFEITYLPMICDKKSTCEITYLLMLCDSRWYSWHCRFTYFLWLQIVRVRHCDKSLKMCSIISALHSFCPFMILFRFVPYDYVFIQPSSLSSFLIFLLTILLQWKNLSCILYVLTIKP